MIPQTNAQLLSVTRGGYTEDYDRASGAGALVWQGNLDSYVQEKFRSNFNAQGELNRVVELTILIPADLPIMMEPGDTIVFALGNPNGPTTRAGRVQNIINPANLPVMPDYYKCACEEVGIP